MWNEGGEPLGAGMECLQLDGGSGRGVVGVEDQQDQPVAQPGPFHYFISEQAKSLVALQELQHEVGALLEFRDLVMETFPNLRSKLAASTPSTMTHHHIHHLHHMQSNIPVSMRGSGEWTPGVRVKKKLGGKDDGRGKRVGDAAVQDSGFSTETSSKETHSASSTAPPPSNPPAADIDESEDELLNLLDLIHRKGTRLRDEVEALQSNLREQHSLQDTSSFQRALFHASPDDVRKLRQERDYLLDRLGELEAEVVTGRVHTGRLQADLDTLLAAKSDLEEQLRAVVSQRGEVNSRIHDLHLQFVAAKGPDKKTSQKASPRRATLLDSVLGDRVPKVARPDSEKFNAILRERDPLVLQKHLLTTTVQNQVLLQELDSASRLQEKLEQAREENDELRFQLADKNIELEGTRARVRVLENLQKPASSPDIIPTVESSTPLHRDHHNHHHHLISPPSMKAMSPIPMALQLDHSSSTESAHDQAESTGRRRRPSKIPLKSYTAPKPPSGGKQPQHQQHSTTAPPLSARSRSGGERPLSAQSWRNRSEASSLSKSQTSLSSKSRHGSLGTKEHSLKRHQQQAQARTGSDSTEKVRSKPVYSIWNLFRRDTGQT